MDAYQLLGLPYKINGRIIAKKMQIQSMRDSLSISAPAADKESVMGGSHGDPICDSVIEIVELEGQLEDLRDDLVKVKSFIIKLLDKMDSEDEIVILTARYLDLRSSADISEETNVCVRTVQIRIKEAIGDFQRIIDAEKDFAEIRQHSLDLSIDI